MISKDRFQLVSTYAQSIVGSLANLTECAIRMTTSMEVIAEELRKHNERERQKSL